ncbi:MAG: hypothetical protein ACI4TF_06545 [Oliverpabstia sp.]
MLNQIIYILCQILNGLVFGYAMDIMQIIRKNRLRRWMRIGIWTGIFVLMAVNKVLMNANSESVALGNMGFIIATVIIIRVFYSGSIWKRAAIVIILAVALMAAECAVVPVCWMMHMDTLSLDFRQLDMVIGTLIGSMISFVCIFLVVVLWQRFEKKIRMPRGSWIYVFLPLCLIIPSMSYYTEIMQYGGKVQMIHIVPMVAAYVMDLVLICIQFDQAEKDSMEQELRELTYQIQQERKYYQNMEERREEMAKIRHDYNNLLSSVMGLIHMGKIQEAEQVLTEILSRVERTEK